jgi:hypothetical protein
MALSDYPSGRGVPSREAFEKALIAVGQQADGAPLGLDEIKRMSDEHLVGYLSALTSDLAERVADGPGGRGNTRRGPVVSGYHAYVESGRYSQSMEEFFTSRAESLGSDMRTWLSLRLMR